MTPYWDSDTMYNESVLMVSDSSGKLPEAKLLFSPLVIQSVKSSGLDTIFKQGVDWTFANGRLQLLAGSKAAFLTKAFLYPTTAGATQTKVGGGFVYWAEGHFFHDRQLSVTYTHLRNAWKGPIPTYAETNLPNTLAKLSKGQPLKFVLIGNSITAGYNASAYTGAAPNMPPYAGLVTENLRANYSSVITLKNVAVAGTDAAWGAANVHTLVTAENPDLVVISFGMNDGTGNVAPDLFLTRIKAIMADVKAGNPTVEFILIATTLANPETGFAGQQANYKAKLQTLVGLGVEMVDMTGVHQELLKFKLFRDMTGNNVNHPNDFLHRWYAQEISGLLIKPKPVTVMNPMSDKSMNTMEAEKVGDRATGRGPRFEASGKSVDAIGKVWKE